MSYFDEQTAEALQIKSANLVNEITIVLQAIRTYEADFRQFQEQKRSVDEKSAQTQILAKTTQEKLDTLTRMQQEVNEIKEANTKQQMLLEQTRTQAKEEVAKLMLLKEELKKEQATLLELKQLREELMVKEKDINAQFELIEREKHIDRERKSILDAREERLKRDEQRVAKYLNT